MEAVIRNVISDSSKHVVAVQFPDRNIRIVVPIEDRMTLEDYQTKIVSEVNKVLEVMVNQQEIGGKLKESMVGQVIKIGSIKPMPPIEVLPEDIVVGIKE